MQTLVPEFGPESQALIPAFIPSPCYLQSFMKTNTCPRGKKTSQVERIISHAFSPFRWKEIQPQP